MPTYTQEGRSMRVDFSDVPEDVLLLRSFSAIEELSRPFQVDLHLLSDDPALDPDTVLEKAAWVTLLTPTGDTRVLHGRVNRLVQLGQVDDLTEYRASVVPWLWFLGLSQDCRVFQNLSVLEIAEQIFREHHETDFRVDCMRRYPKREFCVQYRESPLEFVARILEEEGVFYFFHHGDSGHELVLADSNGAIEPCPAQPEARVSAETTPGEDVVFQLRYEHSVQAGKITLSDYDYLNPGLRLQASAAGTKAYELYHYPGGFAVPDEGDRYARIRLEASEFQGQVLKGVGTCRAFAPGFRFDLVDHYRAELDQPYTLFRVEHRGQAGDYGSLTGGGNEDEYRNEFFAAPHSAPYRPLRRTPKPVVTGSQTATVVGKAGEEVWTDGHGRIKIQFHWDRLGRRDENSSCWIRVAAPWAGKDWGSVSVPRIGNEVIVDFLDGDPDRPIVVGSVYNADQTPPMGGLQMGLKTRSSKGGGGYNEISLMDNKGDELITIHGQLDMDAVIEHDRRESIGNDDTLAVGHDRSVTVGNDREESVGNDQSLTVERDRSERIGQDESLSVARNRTRNVGENESVGVGGDQKLSVADLRQVSVGGNQQFDVGADQAISVGGSETSEISKDRAHAIGKNDSLSVGKKLVIDAGDQVTIRTGKASITMQKDGSIEISGKDITLKASGEVSVKASKDITLKGSKVLQN